MKLLDRFFSYFKQKTLQNPPIEQIYKLSEVFTPGSVARLTYIERPELIENINDALDTTGKQLIIYGNSLSGKTTLVQNILDNKKIKYSIFNCTSDSTFDDLIRHTFDDLNCYYTIESSDRTDDRIESELGASYIAISAKMKAISSYDHSNQKARMLPPELNIQNLAKFIGFAQRYLIIEDFHKVELEERKRMAQALKLMSDITHKYPNTKVIAIGAVDTAEKLIEFDKDLTHRVAQIYIPLMNKNELRSILDKGQKLLHCPVVY